MNRKSINRLTIPEKGMILGVIIIAISVGMILCGFDFGLPPNDTSFFMMLSFVGVMVLAMSCAIMSEE